MTARTALRALRRNKLRSALTMLGVVIGVGAVIVMVSIGQGASAAVRAQIEALGTNLLMVLPGATTRAGVRSGWGGATTLTVADARAIGEECSAVSGVAWSRRQIAQVIQGELNWSTLVQGASPAYFAVRNWPLASGEYFGSRDEETANRVVVLGQTVVDNLFGPGEDPLGAVIRVKDVPFRVIGVLERKGQTTWGQDQDDIVIAPYTTIQKKLLGITYIHQVSIAATSSDAVERTAVAVTQLLRERHKIQNPDDDDFSVRTVEEMAQTRVQMAQTMNGLLMSVASVSLLVGGIGIMNIMLVSVTERTREIGLRLAVGARTRDILRQFLAEAVSLSFVGGMLGMVLGVAVSEGLTRGLGWHTTITGSSILIAFAFAAAVGVFFGYYPARTAANLDPIEALRYE